MTKRRRRGKPPIDRRRLRRAMSVHILTHYEPCDRECADDIASQYVNAGYRTVPLDPPHDDFYALIPKEDS